MAASAQVPASARCVGTSPSKATATATVVGRMASASWGECRLVSVVRGRQRDSVIDLKGESQKKGGISDELVGSIEAVWKRAEAYCNEISPGAHHGDINFSALAISYKDHTGKTHTIDEHSITDPELVGLMRHINNLGKELGQFARASLPGVRSNRPANAPVPLEKTSSAWIQDCARPAEEFLSTHHKDLSASLTVHHPELVANAPGKIRAADRFIEIFMQKLHQKKRQLEIQLQQLEQQRGTIEARLAKRRQLEQMDAQIAKFAQLDKKAIFWNVAYANDDLGATPMTPEEREQDSLQKARDIRSSMASHLASSNTRFGTTLKGRFHPRPDEAVLAAYVKDVGGLSIQDRSTYEQEQHLAPVSEPLALKGGSLEQLVVHTISTLRDPSTTPDDPLSALHVPPGEIHTLIGDAWTEARGELNQLLRRSGQGAPPPAAPHPVVDDSIFQW